MTRDLESVFDACAARNTRLEGIEMIVELEDLRRSEHGMPALMRADGVRLDELEQQALRSRAGELVEGATDKELQQAAEVAAAIDFGFAAA